MTSRLLFVCPHHSSRALLAASLLQALAPERWEVWSTPTTDERGPALVAQVLQEQHIPLLVADRFVQPTLGMRWEEAILLCSERGAT
jgi:protein-tyrosine-phosphatase